MGVWSNEHVNDIFIDGLVFPVIDGQVGCCDVGSAEEMFHTNGKITRLVLRYRTIGYTYTNAHAARPDFAFSNL